MLQQTIGSIGLRKEVNGPDQTGCSDILAMRHRLNHIVKMDVADNIVDTVGINNQLGVFGLLETIL